MSIHSMTGFANAAGESGGRRINLDIRAVNHRYLDVQFKMPDDLRHLESALREAVAGKAAAKSNAASKCNRWKRARAASWR